MQKILVPTDFSRYATYAIEMAASIARKTGGEIILLHVIQQPLYSNAALNAVFAKGASAIKEFSEAIERELISELEMSCLQGLVVDTLVENGVIVDKIIEVAEAQNCDSICMGLLGESDSPSVYGGSVSQRIIRHSHVPVFTVRSSIHHFEPEKIVYCSNFYEENAELLPKVGEIARLYNAELHLLKVITPTHFEKTSYSEKVISDLAAEGRVLDYKSAVVNDKTIEEGVFWYAQKVGAHLICAATHERSGIEQLIHRSVAEEITGHSHIPVMTLKIEEQPSNDGALFPE